MTATSGKSKTEVIKLSNIKKNCCYSPRPYPVAVQKKVHNPEDQQW